MSDSSALTKVKGLGDAPSWIRPDEAALASMLVDQRQTHLFAGWKEGADGDKKHKFFEQVKAMEKNYPGGIVAYLTNARTLLKQSAAGENPFEGYKPEVPTGVSLEYGTPDFIAMEERGFAVFKDSAFVLVAGGLGERLGYTDIKVSLPVEVTTETTYLDLYVQQILAMQNYSNKLNGTNAVVPLAIMTSDDTHQRTEALIKAHNSFGAAPGQITIIKQEKVAALTDNDASIALSESDPYEIDTKPHGHGDVHTLLASSGLAKKWDAEGRKYIVFFQDTNALCFTVTVAAIGVSEDKNYEVNSVTVPRKAKDAVGAITRLVKEDGSSITINVEYNQLEPMLKASGYPEGDVNDPATGYSKFPGNINQLVFKVAPYVKVLERTGGLVPEFVNPKYADATKTKFKKPTRLECMMQEHPKVLGPDAIVGFTTFPDWTYSPVKNSVEEALAKAKVGAPGRSAAEGELEYYAAAGRALTAIGVKLPQPGTFKVLGFELPDPPHIVIRPSFAPSFSTFRAKFPTPAAVQISQRSTIVIDGPDVVIHAMDVDGALVIKAVPGANVVIKRVKAHNAGWQLVPLETSDKVPDSLKIRGFKLVKKEQRVVEFTTPGDFEVNDAD